jgi:hypothetical protein
MRRRLYCMHWLQHIPSSPCIWSSTWQNTYGVLFSGLVSILSKEKTRIHEYVKIEFSHPPRVTRNSSKEIDVVGALILSFYLASLCIGVRGSLDMIWGGGGAGGVRWLQ